MKKTKNLIVITGTVMSVVLTGCGIKSQKELTPKELVENSFEKTGESLKDEIGEFLKCYGLENLLELKEVQVKETINMNGMEMEMAVDTTDMKMKYDIEVMGMGGIFYFSEDALVIDSGLIKEPIGIDLKNISEDVKNSPLLSMAGLEEDEIGQISQVLEFLNLKQIREDITDVLEVIDKSYCDTIYNKIEFKNAEEKLTAMVKGNEKEVDSYIVNIKSEDLEDALLEANKLFFENEKIIKIYDKYIKESAGMEIADVKSEVDDTFTDAIEENKDLINNLELSVAVDEGVVVSLILQDKEDKNGVQFNLYEGEDLFEKMTLYQLEAGEKSEVFGAGISFKDKIFTYAVTVEGETVDFTIDTDKKEDNAVISLGEEEIKMDFNSPSDNAIQISLFDEMIGEMSLVIDYSKFEKEWFDCPEEYNSLFKMSMEELMEIVAGLSSLM